MSGFSCGWLNYYVSNIIRILCSVAVISILWWPTLSAWKQARH